MSRRIVDGCAPEVAEPLSEALLDAEESPEGVRLTLKTAPGNDDVAGSGQGA